MRGVSRDYPADTSHCYSDSVFPGCVVLAGSDGSVPIDVDGNVCQGTVAWTGDVVEAVLGIKNGSVCGAEDHFGLRVIVDGYALVRAGAFAGDKVAVVQADEQAAHAISGICEDVRAIHGHCGCADHGAGMRRRFGGSFSRCSGRLCCWLCAGVTGGWRWCGRHFGHVRKLRWLLDALCQMSESDAADGQRTSRCDSCYGQGDDFAAALLVGFRVSLEAGEGQAQGVTSGCYGRCGW